jgi:peptide-methionine (S)-S-oxide reductase/peptide methionine sulfoxide reductase msrA/msrB
LHVKYYDLTHNYARGKAYPDLQEKHGKALKMVKEAVEEMDKVYLYEPKEGYTTAIFSAGCFWGVQHYFERMKGVLNTYVGYIGGTEENPTYELVRSHRTHHIESILVEYNPAEVSYEDLCKLFFEIHDPGQTDGQGPDKGEQYRSTIFYENNEQLQTVERLIAILREKGYKVNTLIRPASKFWIAEKYHQNYYDNTGGNPYCHIRKKKF